MRKVGQRSCQKVISLARSEMGTLTPYRMRVGDGAWLAIVHVPSHSRHRQNVVAVMTFASVSKRLPLQKGQTVGRRTAGSGREEDMSNIPSVSTIARDTVGAP